MSGAAAAADAFRSEVYKFYMSDDALAGLDSAVVADHYADVTEDLPNQWLSIRRLNLCKTGNAFLGSTVVNACTGI